MTEPRLIYRLTPGQREFLLQLLIEHWSCENCTESHTDHIGTEIEYQELLQLFAHSKEREHNDGTN
jgi:hypothetical protein